MLLRRFTGQDRDYSIASCKYEMLFIKKDGLVFPICNSIRGYRFSVGKWGWHLSRSVSAKYFYVYKQIRFSSCENLGRGADS